VLLCRNGAVVALVALRGEIDVAEAPGVERRLADALAAGGPVIVDLREVTFIDSSGMAVLLRAAQAAARDAHELRLLRPGPPVMRTFQIAGLAERLPFAEP
jgi:anti-sigma B factor antagonist